MSNQVLVKFLKNHTPYAVGDVTGVSEEAAEKLFSEELAVPYKTKESKKEVENPPVSKDVKQPEKTK